MTILVTGGAGYIGSHMAMRLGDDGERFVVYDNLSTGHRSLVPPDADFVEGDLADTARLRQCLSEYEVTEILHFAGSISVPESVADPLEYYRNNTCVSRSLIEAAVDHDVERFIFSSTAAVYGVVGAEPVTETTQTAPHSPYGTSKLMTEWMLRDLAAVSRMQYGVLRYFNVAGADPKGRSGHSTPNATHLIKRACMAALGRQKFLEVYGTDLPTPDGTGVRDYIHVTDLADAHSLLLKYLRGDGESITLNCGYGAGHSVRDVIAMVKEVSGTDFEVRHASQRAGDAPSVVANCDRLRALLDWKPKHASLRDMVESAYNWELRLARSDEFGGLAADLGGTCT